MKRRRAFGAAIAKTGGYVKSDGKFLTDWHGKVIGKGRKISCSRIRPGAPGSSMSNERCSYQFKINGQWYAGRGYGDGMSVSLRPIRPPRNTTSPWWDRLDLEGARRRRRR